MKVLLAVNPKREDSALAATESLHYLENLGIECHLAVLGPENTRASIAREQEGIADRDFDLVLTFGGDGTILRAARLIDFRPIPILGFNFGHLGFLTGASGENALDAIAAALSGETTAEYRTCLFASIEYADGETEHVAALNEIAFTQGGRGSMVDFSMSINGIHIADMRGDGIIVSTATGSTAYALAAGGPIVSPSYPGMVVVPVSPHTLVSRAIVTAPSDVIEVTTTQSAEGADLFFDGVSCGGKTIKSFTVERNRNGLVFMRYDRDTFYRATARDFFGAIDA